MRLLSRTARRRYDLGDLGDASHTRLRQLAHAINEERRSAGQEAAVVHAGELGALLLLQDLMAAMLADYLRDEHSQALEHALGKLDAELGRRAVDELLSAFIAEFETSAGGVDLVHSLATPTARLAVLEALVVLWQLNRNPALEALRELIDDRRLEATIYAPAMRLLEADLRRTTRGQSTAEGDLIDRLQTPARTAPRSIAAQLDFFLEQPAEPVGVPRLRLRRALDALREERLRPQPGPGPIEVPQLDDLPPVSHPRLPRAEPDWMREVVVAAKHTHVWLDQLTRSHRRPITRLDEVPDEELARLAGLGFSGLWLVGVWERSPASRRIKRLAGNQEAEASAYSIFDYRVASDLGGDAALENLQERALTHGIRLGVDVVPNHFGIDSRWLRDHPERFLSTRSCPFPGYTFDGPDLSADPDIGIYLEDHYYDQSDAAVVFRHLDRRTGQERFIYHGNDGTGTPWNDTAQLDYSLPEVRAAMTELIVALAQRFRILRFDAAMTLTRMHFQRLWFPPAGSGGAVPSRSEHGLSIESFARAMPSEFWLDVVERVEAEAPDTLLIAEAFWLMEPYFVRELGMHRVYNSAFMHLLRERENDKLQRLLRETMAYDPELLRRSVNFMTTPDEASAAEQFGTGDRYFGVCTLLAALPGLPLFGHGQVEGLAEKYGMEYRRARTREAPDEELVARHRREIRPLLAQRERFADVDELRLLDFVDGDGVAQNDVYALCSGSGKNTRIVVFNNSDREVKGYLRPAVPAGEPDGPDRSVDLASLLGSDAADEETVALRDARTGFEAEHRGEDLRSIGLGLE
ncbi:MAG: alpha-amylase family glycosyl hydrolase, partial [Acidobacteria bacterium]|nr:alpha-amylase family glycosyl hydrolase [Acidobacteriota bacterium]